MDVPRRVWVGLAVGLGLLVVGGVLGAVQTGMQEFYFEDCAPYYDPNQPIDRNGTVERRELSPEERDACEDDLDALIAVDAVQRATLGPGIALVALSGIYLVALAIAGRDEEQT